MIVVYHKACRDGFASAWACRTVYPNATFIAANYGETKGADGYLYGDHGKPTYGRPLDYPRGPNDIPGVW